jgi:transcriptional regulator GlxA family with amidase domain
MGKVTRRDVITAAATVTGAALLGRSATASPDATSTASALPRPDKPVPVAFLLDDYATMIDFSGPWEVFQDAGVAGVPGFELFTVAPKPEPLTASGGMKIVPDYTLDNAPQAKVIVIPAQAGGRQPVAGSPKVAWLKARYPAADVIMSVCTGAFLLAQTGLLSRLSATTHHAFLDDFARQYPGVRLLKNQRFVENGKLMTTGGLSSGIEGALRIVERYYGADTKTEVADYMEYVSHTWSEAVLHAKGSV